MKNIYIERQNNYQSEAQHLVDLCQNTYNLKSINEAHIVHVFETEKEYTDKIISVLNNPLNDIHLREPYPGAPKFHIKAVDGQFDNVLDRTLNQIQKICQLETDLAHSLLFIFPNANEKEVEKLNEIHTNPYEYVDYHADFFLEDTSYENNPIENFINFDLDELKEFKENLGMDIDDLIHIQKHFKGLDTNPNMTTLKILDTYWSDHCRHTTFFTHLDEIEILDEKVKAAYASYLESRKLVYGDTKRPITLMDLATINAKEINLKGLLKDWDKSDEVNAISLNIDIDVDGKTEPWQVLFKNETHNHPTEIEPYGGASTCFGGCVRDPLSGRGMVYQGMRISGSKDPLTSYENTRADKFMSKRISQEALNGFSDYANQIGIKSGYAEEYYHDGFEAKRFELGALVAAVRQDVIQKTEPQKDDIVILLGGQTGRDGLGAAVGSSKTQTEESLLSAGAEVQKGNPMMEHKIVRLFRRSEVLEKIKRCNDFGAGGVSVAVGELCDGIDIYLDKVDLKYEMHPGEIALSESQERMAVVIDKNDEAAFLAYCHEENVPANVIAKVTDTNHMNMYFEDELIVSLDRDFLNTNGSDKNASLKVENYNLGKEEIEFTEAKLIENITNIHNASRKGMRQRFDSFIMDLDQDYDFEIAQEAMVSKLPVSKTETASYMSAGFALKYSDDPYLLGYYSVIESIARLVASGANPEHARLSMQEYFERLTSKEKWGKPFAALLGAFTVMKAWDIPALGGKDSMSGSFEDIDVPPTLVSFALQTGNINDRIKRNLVSSDNKLVYVKFEQDENGLLDLNEVFNQYKYIHQLIKDKKVYSASTVNKSVFLSLFEMSLLSSFGLEILNKDILLDYSFTDLILEVDKNFNEFEDLALINDSNIITVANISLNKDELNNAYEATLEEVFPSLNLETNEVKITGNKLNVIKDKSNKLALVPILNGTNGDFDIKNRLLEAGFTYQEVVISDHASNELFLEYLEKADLLVLANGYSISDDITISGYEYKLFLNNERIKPSFEEFRQEKTVLGIGSGALALSMMDLLGEVEYMPIGNYYYKTKALITNEAHEMVAGLLGQELELPMSVRYVFENVDPQYSFIEAQTKVKGSNASIGLVKDNVIGVLGSIDQVSSEMFKNLKENKKEGK